MQTKSEETLKDKTEFFGHAVHLFLLFTQICNLISECVVLCQNTCYKSTIHNRLLYFQIKDAVVYE
jgi:hypothetical protein